MVRHRSRKAGPAIGGFAGSSPAPSEDKAEEGSRLKIG